MISNPKHVKGDAGWNLFWHNTVYNSHGAHISIAVNKVSRGGSDTITVNLGRSYTTVNIYDPTVGTLPWQTLTDTPSVTLTLTNHPVVLEIKG